MRAYAQNLKPLSRNLRVSMTDAEQRLWHKVRRQQILGIQFYRQRPIGPYIVDFCAPRVNLVVEVDGGSISSPSMPNTTVVAVVISTVKG